MKTSFLLGLMISSFFLVTQNRYDFIPKLKKVTADKIETLPDSAFDFKKIVVYLYDGSNLSQDSIKFRTVLDSSKYIPDYFEDTEGKIKAMVFRKATKKDFLSIEELDKQAKALKGKQAPAFKLTTLSGKQFTNKNLLGKTVVLNFWFIACPPCVEEIPELNALAASYSNQKDIVFLSVTFDKAEKIEVFLKKHPFNYQHISRNSGGLKAIKAYMISTFPTHMVINSDGLIALSKVSGSGIKKVKKYLEKQSYSSKPSGYKK